MDGKFGTAGMAICLLLSSCGLPPFQRCYSERIEVSWPATIERNGAVQSEILSGVAALTNVPEHFSLLKSILTENPVQRTEAVVWTVPAFQTNGGYIAVALRAPLRPGDSLRVTSAFEGGGWGRFELPTNSKVQVGVRADNYVATSASGTIQILAVAPLQLRLDLETRNASGAILRVRGEADFSYHREQVPCD